MITNIMCLKTPCYICDMRAFEKNIRDIERIVKIRYPNFRIGFSYKTNYYQSFQEVAKRLGCYAEIVSPKEYVMALEVGNSDKDIIYNGVIGDFANKLRVALAGGIVNIENIPELIEFVNFTNKHAVDIEVGIRVNFDVGNGLVSRFGIDVESSDYEWLKDPSNHPFLSFKCVHFHLGGARAPEYFRSRVRKAVVIARELGAKIVDIGGNIYGRMGDDFKAQLPFTAPSLEEVCEAIGDEMLDCCPEVDMELIAECGSPVCSDAMHLLTTITNVNEVRGHVFITCDCRNTDAGWSVSKYDPTHLHYSKRFKFEPWKDPVADTKNLVKDAVVCGCECREKDILIRNYNGPASVGDRLLIKNVGSYSYSVVNDFITPGCRSVVPIEEVQL